MILAVDATRAVEPTGVGRVLQYLLRAWSQGPVPFEGIRVLAPTPLADLPRDERLTLDLVPGSGSGTWWQLAHLRRSAEGADVLFAAYTVPPGFRGRSVVYNLGVYEGPYTLGGWAARVRTWRMARSARRAEHVFAVSSTTKSDLEHYYRVPSGRISIAWPGLDPRFRPAREEEFEAVSERIAAAIGGEGPYFLFVGKPSRRRNLPALIEGFAGVAASGDARLLIVGSNAPNDPLERLVGELGLDQRVKHLAVDRETLILLYRFARGFVMPTENDGFSLTILEAMASGVPVVTLRGAPLGVLDRLDGPRDYGQGGPVLEAADARPADLAEAMTRLAEDDELCAELGRRGQRYAATFPSWDETAKQIMDVVAEVAAVPPARHEQRGGHGGTP